MDDGGKGIEDRVHPFRKYFEELKIGETLITPRRTVSEADIVNFAGVSGDYFYAHMDEIAAKDLLFEKRVAHGYFVLSAAGWGFFVDPAPGTVQPNYGLDNLRFIEPVGIGDTIQAKLTCMRKTRKPLREEEKANGVVVWNVEVSNQNGEMVALYNILTLVEWGKESLMIFPDQKEVKAIVKEIREETNTIKWFRFEVQESGFHFLPGQWLDLRPNESFPWGGYSMMTSPEVLPFFELGLRKEKVIQQQVGFLIKRR